MSHAQIKIHRQPDPRHFETGGGWHTRAGAMPRTRGMSNATFYKWRAKYGGMDASLERSLEQIVALGGSCLNRIGLGGLDSNSEQC